MAFAFRAALQRGVGQRLLRCVSLTIMPEVLPTLHTQQCFGFRDETGVFACFM
jgi:hypothetical protein